jgi:predicted dehydrogenase
MDNRGVTEVAGGLRVGVVGCGYWGSKHVRVLCGLPEVTQVVLVDGVQARLDALAAAFPSVRTFSSVQEALPHLDALVIATPPTTHVSLALAAIAAGKHVLVEKPLATSTFAAQRMIDAAEQAGVVLMVGHTFEHNGAVHQLRELVQSGALGDVFYLDSARLNLGLYQSDVNVMMDLAPHDISIINCLLGTPPTAVQAWAARHAHHQFEDVAYLRLYYADQSLSANIHVSWLDPCKVRRTTVVGSKKMAVYNDLQANEPIRIHDKGVVLPPDTAALGQPPLSYRYGDIVTPFVSVQEPLMVQDRTFAQCVLTGTAPRTDGRNGLAVVQVLECAQWSLELGRRVEMTEVADDTSLRRGSPQRRQHLALADLPLVQDLPLDDVWLDRVPDQIPAGVD